MCTCRGRGGEVTTKAACTPSLNMTSLDLCLDARLHLPTPPIPGASPIPGYPVTLKWPGPEHVQSLAMDSRRHARGPQGTLSVHPSFLRPHLTEGRCLGCSLRSVCPHLGRVAVNPPHPTPALHHDRNCSAAEICDHGITS